MIFNHTRAALKGKKPCVALQGWTKVVRRMCLQSLSEKLDLVDSTLRNHAARVALTSDTVATLRNKRRWAVRKTSTCLREGPVRESQRPVSVFWALHRRRTRRVLLRLESSNQRSSSARPGTIESSGGRNERPSGTVARQPCRGPRDDDAIAA